MNPTSISDRRSRTIKRFFICLLVIQKLIFATLGHPVWAAKTCHESLVPKTDPLLQIATRPIPMARNRNSLEFAQLLFKWKGLESHRAQLLSQLKSRAPAVKDFENYVSFILELFSACDNTDEWMSTIGLLPLFKSLSGNLFSSIKKLTKLERQNLETELKLLANEDRQLVASAEELKIHPQYLDLYLQLLSGPSQVKLLDLIAKKFTFPQGADGKLKPIHQMLYWMAHYNLAGSEYHRTSYPIPLDVRQRPEDQVSLNQTTDLPPWLKKVFVNPERNVVSLPQHPWSVTTNLDRVPADNPFFNDPHLTNWIGYFTGSRSIVIESGEHVFSVKLPTRRPSPANAITPWNSKADLRKSVQLSLQRSRLVQKIDESEGSHPNLIVLREKLAVIDPITGNGFTVRDMDALLDGHYYLPSYSVHSFARNLENDLYRLQGKMQALLLIKYGLVHKFPHLQNSMIQVDSTFRPTESIVTYDLSDTMLNSKVAGVIAPDFLSSDEKDDYKISHSFPEPDFFETPEEYRSVLAEEYWNTISRELKQQFVSIDDSNVEAFLDALRKYHSHQ